MESKQTASSLLIRRMIYTAIAAIIIAVLFAAGMAVCAVRTALVAEENLQAFFHAHRATLEYIQQNDGQWPKSWDDLHSVRPESDFAWVAEHLTFDFNADPRKIADQTPDTFTAIVPNKPCYIVDDRVQVLIDVLSKHYSNINIATEHSAAPR